MVNCDVVILQERVQNVKSLAQSTESKDRAIKVPYRTILLNCYILLIMEQFELQKLISQLFGALKSHLLNANL